MIKQDNIISNWIKTAALIFIIGLVGCNEKAPVNTEVDPQKIVTTGFKVPELNKLEEYPGGQTSVSTEPFASLMKPAANLSQQLRPEFHAGKALAHQPWIKAPTITAARDGLGPLYNARTCLACHVNGGRGRVPDNNSEVLFSTILRLSIPGEDKINGVIAEPNYGDQLQTQSVSLVHQLRTRVTQNDVSHQEVMPEAYLYINWQEKIFTYPDSQSLTLRSPKIDIRNLGYGTLDESTLMSIRVAPPIHGVGLLEMIAQNDIELNADPNDLNADGISGAVNQVWDFEQKKSVPGRFGLKANKPNLRHQVAGAFLGDVGITTPIFPQQNCTQSQQVCRRTHNGNDKPENGGVAVELSESLLSLVTNFNKNIGVPKRYKINQPEILEGRSYFYQTGCQQCHIPSYVTGKSPDFPHLSKQTIWPYTDLLLHDMGAELADNRPDYLATGSEWRTPPLWSIGLSQQVNGSRNFLHDGRAKTIEEAIIWHGGEAEAAKIRFASLNQQQRASLIAFVKSL